MNMEYPTLKSHRLHSMDALRAVMMLLGVVLHATELYSMGEDPYWPKDPSARSLSMNYIFGIIHIFRMPIFFLVAGFFGAMLFYERGPLLMIKNRLSRVLFPFVVFLFLLHPFIILAWRFTANAFDVGVAEVLTRMTFTPSITYHLWFLYYLILITALAFALAKLLKVVPTITRKITQSFEWLFRRRLVFILFFSIMMFLILVWMWDTWISTPLSFVPNVPVLAAYGMFYLLGWVLFKSKSLLNSFLKGDWLFTIIAIVIFTVRFFMRPYIDDVLYGALNAINVWFFIFGIMGLFIRYTSKHSAKMRYISDSSYWVYLIHLPLVTFSAGLIADLQVPVFIKFLIVIGLTTLVSFTTYHYLVRRSFIGKFLNGRRYK